MPIWAQGIASNRWINYQQFIQTLEKAIEQHRQQLTQWTQKVDVALNSWREKKQRLQAWQTLQDRQSAAALLAENRLDQKKMDEFAPACCNEENRMITLPQLITTDTDVTTGLQAGKTADSAQDFLALLAGALGAGDAQGKDAPLSLADLQAAGGKLQKGLLQKNGDTPQTTALADLLARQDLLTDDATADLTEAQQLLSTLTPSLKSNALNALSKTARQDDNAPALSDEDLANLSALFAMLPGQPALTPTTRTASAEGALSAPASLRGDTRAATQDAVAGLTTAS
ncbi:flagellar hook-length control protein [Citrobacter koseri]|uniref:Flagellar FliJ protein n=1 Tax=Citrobacter koseri TaxID=545 RepID=A0A2X2W0L1_CITKO|nr:flagellar hook-length control protein [Citrobacter koseri]